MMISEQLMKAREYDEKGIALISAEERPAFHVTGGIGWINDPNGFSVYKGEYHLFFQYHPYSNHWGPMHWGHVKSRDFIKWEFLPVALAPDAPFDQEGCFSGSAVEMPDGRHLLMYTGVHRHTAHDAELPLQEQCVALGDGVNYEKYDGNPVIRIDKLPEGGSIHDFRDPKIWRDGDEFYAVVGNRTPDSSGAILLFRSKDALNWSYVSTLDASQNEYGKMWECPDFFEVDGKYILITSPQEMEAKGAEYYPGFNVIAIAGSFDKETGKFDRESVQKIDFGHDFYAPQTLQTEDGRRVMIAWMQNWTTASTIVDERRLHGEMTVPRELHFADGRLIQTPVRELEHYRQNEVVYHDVVVKDEVYLEGVSGRSMDLTVRVRPKEEGKYGSFTLRLAKNGDKATWIKYTPQEDLLRVDRLGSASCYDFVHKRKFNVDDKGGEITLRVIMDKHSIELFVNGGVQTASLLLYDSCTEDGVTFEASDEVLVDVEKYNLVID